MMTESRAAMPQTDYDELERQAEERVRRRLAQANQARQQEIPDESRLWMALTPGWTAALADSCDYPGAKQAGGVEQLFDRMQKAGLIEAYVSDTNAADLNAPADFYIMNNGPRSEVLQAYLQRRPSTQTGLGAVMRRGTVIGDLLRGRNPKEWLNDVPTGLLLDTAAKIGQRIERVAGSSPNTPARVKRWAGLAARVTESELVVDYFRQQVAESAATTDLEVGVGVVRDWIEAARPLATLLEYALDPQLSIAIALASRRMELIQRRKYDLRHLASFYRRPEQVRAVKDLLTGPDERWALHFIGAGGVGKTMVIRYITCALTWQRGPDTRASDFRSEPEFADLGDIAIARVDFDYLNPDYPRLRPGLLLTALAEELRAYDDKTGKANSYFDKCNYLLDQLHKRLKVDAYDLPYRPSQDSLFQDAVKAYIDALNQLQRPILLILDTCEELDKAYFEGVPSENVEETFRILRALHDGPGTLNDVNAQPVGGVPSLRVLLSGRRPLANRGYGWSMENPSIGARLQPLDFLQLHEIRGFTYSEAEEYLNNEKVPVELRDAVIQASTPDAGSSLKVRWDDSASGSVEVPRCNPYRLHIFMDWAKVEPPPDRQVLLSASVGKYVEMRIIGRLGDPTLERVLPVVALLGHFDQQLLQETTHMHEGAVASTFEKLCEQEWTGTHLGGGSADGQAHEIIDVERNLLDSLYAYYVRQGEVPKLAWTAAADYIEALSLNPARDLATLDWSLFDAALRVLELELERGASWWQKIEARTLKERGLKWMEDLTVRLTGRDGSAGPRDPQAGPDIPQENRLRPWLLATQARLYQQTGRTSKLAGLWETIATRTRDRKDSPASQRLYRQALAGQIASYRFTQSIPDIFLVQEFWLEFSRPDVAILASWQDAASAVAACEALVEIAERLAQTGSTDVLTMLGCQSAEADPSAALASGPKLLADTLLSLSESWQMDLEATARNELVAFCCSLAGRSLLLAGDVHEALGCFQHALEHLPSPPRPQSKTNWAAYWLPPEDIGARVRLEVGRAGYPALLSATETLALIEDYPPDPTCVDVDRLQSLRLQLRLATECPPLDSLAPLGWVDAKSQALRFRENNFSPGSAICNAHRQIPPLFVSVSEVWASHGLLEAAIRQLRYATQNLDRNELDTVRHAERSLLRLIWRMRLNEEHENAETSLSKSMRIEDRVLSEAVAGLDGRGVGLADSYESGDDLLTLHGAWQTFVVPFGESPLNDQAKRSCSRLSAQADQFAEVDDSYDFPHASCNLDLLELQSLGETHPEIRLMTLSNETSRSLTTSRALSEPFLLGFDPLKWRQDNSSKPVESLRLMLRTLALDETYRLPAVPPSLISQVGERRAAELAYEEAELLALRLPDRALWLFDWAFEHYETCGDHLNAFLACAMATFLAASLPGNDGEAATGTQKAGVPVMVLQQRIDAQVSAYSSLRDALKEMSRVAEFHLPPTAEELQQIASQSTAQLVTAKLDELPSGAYRPWLVRTIACLLQRNDFKTIDVFGNILPMEGLHRWVSIQSGVSNGTTQQRLPLDWNRFFSGRIRTVEATSDLGTNVLIAGLLVVALVAVGAIAAIGFLIFRWSDDRVTGGYLRQLSPAAQGLRFILTVVGLILIAWLIFRSQRSVKALWRRLVYFDVTITAAADTGKATPSVGRDVTWSSTSPVKVEITLSQERPRLARPWPPYVLIRDDLAKSDFSVFNGVPYSELASSLPASVSNEFAKRTPKPGSKNFNRLLLHPDRGLDELCWEATFALSGADVEKVTPIDIPLYFERRTEMRRPAVFDRKAPVAGVSLAATPVSAAVFGSSWKGQMDGGKLSWRQLQPPREPVQGVSILHIVGDVIEDLVGVCLQLTPTSDRTSQMQEWRSSSSASGSDGQLTLRASDFRRFFPDLVMCVVQGYPNDVASTRLESDRRAANLSRTFAAQVAGEGITIVVIPPCPPALAAQIWQELSTPALGSLYEGANVLHPTLAQIRQMIFEHASDKIAGWERALDVCFYAQEVPEDIAKSVAAHLTSATIVSLVVAPMIGGFS